jgi:DNA-nicking Smr family endonuclease
MTKSKKVNSLTPEDIKVWEDFNKNNIFISSKKEDQEVRLPFENKKKDKSIDYKIDLHGNSLNQATALVKKIIEQCYEQGLRNILIVTGKGLRSRVKENPYLSEDLSLLKFSVPKFIKDNFSNIVISIAEAPKDLGGSGALLVKLKKR